MGRVYSVKGSSFEGARKFAEEVLAITFEERESLYMNGRYFSHRDAARGQVRLVDNTKMDFEGEVVYLEYEGHSYILLEDGADVGEVLRHAADRNERLVLLESE